MAKFLFYDDQLINILAEDERPSGGAAVQAYGWIKGLQHLGQDVEIITLLRPGVKIKEECKNITLHPIFNLDKGIRWFRWLYYRIPYIYKKFKSIKPDYLYQGIPSWHSFVYVFLCKTLGIKYIQRISNDYLLDDRFYEKHSRFQKYFQNWGIQLSYCILCQNNYQLEIIQKQYPRKKVLKISNPIFFSYKKPEEEPDNKYIAWIGLFQQQKNMKLLYEIACLLPDEKFRIAGKVSNNKDPETEKYLPKLEALPNVQFIGFLERREVIPFLSKAKFLLNTSRYEGFSNTFLESMVAGTPILSTDKVNPDDIISKHNLGVIYQDAWDLEKKYRLADPVSTIAMGINCQNYVKKNHDYIQLTQKLLDFLEVSAQTSQKDEKSKNLVLHWKPQLRR